MNGSSKAKKKRGGIFGKPSVREQLLESKAEAFFAREVDYPKPWTKKGKIKRYLELLPANERNRVQQEIEKRILESQKRVPDRKAIEKIKMLKGRITQLETKEKLSEKKARENLVKIQRLENHARLAEEDVQETYQKLQEVQRRLNKRGKGTVETQQLLNEKIALARQLNEEKERSNQIVEAFNTEQEKTKNLKENLSRIEKEKEKIESDFRILNQDKQSSDRILKDNERLLKKIEGLGDEKLDKDILEMGAKAEEESRNIEKIRLGTQITERERKRQEELLKQLKEENAINAEKEVKLPVFEEINPLRTVEDIGKEVDRIFKLNLEGKMPDEEWDRRTLELGELTRKIENPTKAEAQELRDRLMMDEVEKAVIKRGFLGLNKNEARVLGKAIEKESGMSSQNAAFISDSVNELLKKAKNVNINDKLVNNLKEIQDKLLINDLKGIDFEKLHKSMKKLEVDVKKLEKSKKVEKISYDFLE